MNLVETFGGMPVIYQQLEGPLPWSAGSKLCALGSIDYGPEVVEDLNLRLQPSHLATQEGFWE